MKAIRLAWLVISLLAGAVFPSVGADPVLRFPDGLSWKDVFDSGFRPKHLEGLSRTTCICADQKFTLEMTKTGKEFPFDTGRLSFQLQSDDTVAVFEHVGWVPISLEEGERRLQAFREFIGEENLRGKGRVPPVIDPRTNLVNAENEYFANAKLGRYWVSYGFGASFRKEAPLVPRLQIGWTSENGTDSPPVRRKDVEPPAGYEWFSLDPKIDTPSPGVRRPATEQPRSAGEVMAAADAALRNQKSDALKHQVATHAKTAWPWLVGPLVAALVGLVIMIWYWRRKQAR
ncbi:MAG: hypothetical protein EOP84_35485 [Verrucomicrobiaceae bacterium]|nr:MAG: hypothetical protein EOP84_35485 [Verrucomicrobiaceae bacterium]